MKKCEHSAARAATRLAAGTKSYILHLQALATCFNSLVSVHSGAFMCAGKSDRGSRCTSSFEDGITVNSIDL